MSTKKVRNVGVYGNGSFGLYSPSNEQLIVVWSCGREGLKERNGVFQDPCMHRSRAEARVCHERLGRAGDLAKGGK